MGFLNALQEVDETGSCSTCTILNSTDSDYDSICEILRNAKILKLDATRSGLTATAAQKIADALFGKKYSLS
jgi:hypothetical protein